MGPASGTDPKKPKTKPSRAVASIGAGTVVEAARRVDRDRARRRFILSLIAIGR